MGNLLNESDRFCSKCGQSVNGNQNQGTQSQGTQSQGIQVNIFRKEGFVAALAKYGVYINAVKVGSLSNGDSMTYHRTDSQKFLLKIQPSSDSMSLHKMECKVEIDPSRCKTNIVNCRIVTKANVIGAIAPLFSAPGKISVLVDYQ